VMQHSGRMMALALAVLMAAGLSTSVAAEKPALRLAAILSDNLILQRDVPAGFGAGLNRAKPSR